MTSDGKTVSAFCSGGSCGGIANGSVYTCSGCCGFHRVSRSDSNDERGGSGKGPGLVGARRHDPNQGIVSNGLSDDNGNSCFDPLPSLSCISPSEHLAFAVDAEEALDWKDVAQLPEDEPDRLMDASRDDHVPRVCIVGFRTQNKGPSRPKLLLDEKDELDDKDRPRLCRLTYRYGWSVCSGGGAVADDDERLLELLSDRISENTDNDDDDDAELKPSDSVNESMEEKEPASSMSSLDIKADDDAVRGFVNDNPSLIAVRRPTPNNGTASPLPCFVLEAV